MSEKMTISERIFHILKERGISQKEFSEQTGITQSSISDWKRKKTNPNAEKIMIICDVLKISPVELLQDTPRSNNHVSEGIIVSEGTLDYEILTEVQPLPKDAKIRLLGYVDALRKLQLEPSQKRTEGDWKQGQTDRNMKM